MHTSQIPGAISVALFPVQCRGNTENVPPSRVDKNFGKKERFRQAVHVSGKKISTLEKTRLNRLSGADYGINSSTTKKATDDIDLVEHRTAFKTVEVITDIRNRPRMLRMEIEERIKQLANWLNATDVNMPEWQFSQMMHKAKIKFTDHSILRVVQILGDFGNWRRVLQVVEWLQSNNRFKSYKSKYIYTTVLNVLGKAKRPMEALNIFYSMRQDRTSYPDLAAYHCISVTLGQAGLMKELFDVIDCMKSTPEIKFNTVLDQKWDPRLEPDLVVYNSVLNACVQTKHWEGAFWVLQQLKQKGIQPSSATYGLVMEVMLECGRYNLVHEFFQKAEKTCIPNTLSYKVLVNTLWREGKIDEAVLAVQDMERRGIVGSASLYYDLARCLCSVGRCEEALVQVDKICKVAKKPLVVTYTGLIQACLDSGGIQNAKYIFNKMHNFCLPNVITCNILLKSYLEHSLYDEAVNLFQKLAKGVYFDQRKGNLRGRVSPDKFTFNTMLEAAATAEKWNDVEYIFSEMLNHGYHFDERRHLHLVINATKAGKVKVLDRTWEYLIRSSLDPPVPIVREWVRVKLKEGDHVAVVSSLTIQHNDKPNDFSVDSWLCLLKLDANDFKRDNILSLIHEIEVFLMSSASPQPTLKNLLQASIKYLRTHSTMCVE